MKILQKISILKNRQLGTFVEIKAKILIINFSKYLILHSCDN